MRRIAYSVLMAMFLLPLAANAYLVKADDTVSQEKTCANENESAGGSAIGTPAQCCKDLTFISSYGHSRYLKHHDCAKAQAEAKLPPPGMGGACTKCGDGICKEPEDSCSCPADCKK